MSELPVSWLSPQLDEVADQPDYGYTASADVSADGPLFLRITDIQNGSVDWANVPRCACERIDRYALAAGDIVVARTGATTGKSYQIDSVPGQAVFASYLVRVRPSTVLNPDWVKYYFQSPAYWSQIEENKAGSAQPGVNASKLAALHIPIAPRQEQNRIVARLDGSISRSTRARHELDLVPKLIDRYKQAILSKAFSGELTADWRSQNACDAAQFMKATGIGISTHLASKRLPKGWYWAQAGQVSLIKSGIALGKRRPQNTELTELPYLRVANVQRGWLNLSAVKTTSVTKREAEALYLQTGDILMNEGGDRDKLGRGWIWEGQVEQCIHQNHVFRLRPKSRNINSRYISYYANEFGQRYFLDEGKQTTNLASISMSKVSALPIPFCRPEEMDLIVERIEVAFSWLDKIATEHSRADHLLPKLEQAILAKAFRGELIPQDPNDEPASVLLERIRAERDGNAKPRQRRTNS